MTLREAMMQWFKMTGARYLLRSDLECKKHPEMTTFMDESIVLSKSDYDNIKEKNDEESN